MLVRSKLFLAAAVAGCTLLGTSASLAATSLRVAENDAQCTRVSGALTMSWTCSDGTPGPALDSECRTSEAMQRIAASFCSKHCGTDATKCVSALQAGETCTKDMCSGQTSSMTTMSSSSASVAVCPMSKDDAYAKAKACAAQAGMRPVMKTEGQCWMYVDCVQGGGDKSSERPSVTNVSSMSSSSESTSVAAVSCKHWMAGRCSLVKCDDGFQMNSCDMQCKVPTLTTHPTTTQQGKCSLAERLVKELKTKLASDTTNADLLKQLTEATTKWTICTGASGGAPSVRTTNESNCTVTKMNSCWVKTCNGTVVAKSCPPAGTTSSDSSHS